ncbi:hypothetical protein FGF1_20190 [Flavobacteriaceae bacterium GF1]
MILFNRLEALITDMEEEISSLAKIKQEFSLRSLNIDINLDVSKKEQTKLLQLEHKMKVEKNGVLLWNQDYKKETIQATYFLVLADVISKVQLLAAKLKTCLETYSEKQLKKKIKSELKKLTHIIESHDGQMFYNEGYRKQKNNLLKTRFEVIWNINEQFSLFPLLKRDKKATILTSAEYPFISFDIDQWINLELAYRLIPVLKSETATDENKINLVQIEKCPFSVETHIFNSNGEDILFTILKRSGNISYQKGCGIEKTSGFRGGCNYLFDILKRPSIGVLKDIYKKEFVQYLNIEKGYNAKIKDLSKIANENTTLNASNRIDKELLLLYPKIILD